VFTFLFVTDAQKFKKPWAQDCNIFILIQTFYA